MDRNNLNNTQPMALYYKGLGLLNRASHKLNEEEYKQLLDLMTTFIYRRPNERNKRTMP